MIDHTNIADLAREAFAGHGRNMITDRIDGYGSGTYAGYSVVYELSSGEGIFDRGRRLYGVTFRVKIDGYWSDPWRHADKFPERMSRCFESEREAHAYIVEMLG